MDLITEYQDRRLDALGRVVAAEPLEDADLGRGLVASVLLIVGGVAAVGLSLAAAAVGVLWLFG